MTNTYDEYVEKAARLTLAKPALPALQQLIGLLVDHDITPLHLHADSIATEQPRASLTLWTHTRTEIERLAAVMGCKTVEKTGRGRGEREFWFQTSLGDVSLLVQCVSLPHHDDWQPKEVCA